MTAVYAQPDLLSTVIATLLLLLFLVTLLFMIPGSYPMDINSLLNLSDPWSQLTTPPATSHPTSHLFTNNTPAHQGPTQSPWLPSCAQLSQYSPFMSPAGTMPYSLPPTPESPGYTKTPMSSALHYGLPASAKFSDNHVTSVSGSPMLSSKEHWPSLTPP